METGQPGGETWQSMSQVAPPTSPGEVGALALGSRWPNPVGVCGIVYASFGIIGGCVTFAGSFGSKFLATMMSNSPGSGVSPAMQAQFDVQAQYAWVQLVLGPVFFAIAVWLLIASIGVVRRLPWGARQTVPICALRLVAGLAQVGVTLFITSEALNAMRAIPSHSQGDEAAVIFGAVIGVVFGVAWSLIYPGFAIVWFSRGKIRREVATWNTPGAVGV